MAIQALPEATSHSLGSSQVLPSPAALVKELLDNALDAKATSIDIAISANTLDKIEVRDNGHGIAPGDLDALGRRGYTSKLRKFEELKTIGGLSLGFRGEALASATELGQVSIITRTEGDTVATAVKLKARGGLEYRNLVSHPVGTTVSIVDFFSKIPVRKQNALKDAKKTLSRIKDILQSYALARPNIRLSLRVHKAEKDNWSFAPRPKDSIRDIVSQVISRDVAAQCMENISAALPLTYAWAHDPEQISNSKQLQKPAFIFQAFLPKPEADLSKVTGRQYVSVDSRPVSCARGTLRKLVTAYKGFINGITADAKLEKVKNPFLRLNIVCSVASYDPNVEPAKDNVLFEDEPLLLSMAEEWLKSIYSTHGRLMELSCKQQNPEVQRDFSPSFTKISSSEGTQMYICQSLRPNDGRGSSRPLRKETLDDITDIEAISYANNVTLESTPPCAGSKTKDILQVRTSTHPRLDMSEDYTEEMEPEEYSVTPCIEPSIQTDVRIGTDNLKGLDPWVIAKINTALFGTRLRDIESSNSKELSNIKSPAAVPIKCLGTYSPRTSLQVSKMNHLPWNFQSSPEDAVRADSLQSSLDNWLEPSHAADVYSRESCAPTMSPLPTQLYQTNTSESNSGGVTAEDPAHCFQRSPPATQKHIPPKKPARPYKLFISPLRISKSKLLQTSPKTVSASKGLPSRHLQYNEHSLDILSDVEQQSALKEAPLSIDVQDALDFERRKEIATLKLRAELRRSQANSGITARQMNGRARTTSFKNHFQAPAAMINISQKASTSEKVVHRVPAEMSLSDGDPRAYLMRRQHSTPSHADTVAAKPKLKRTKTTLLPLETTPVHMELHCLVQLINVDVAQIRRTAGTLAGFDEYAVSGELSRGLEYARADVVAVENRIGDVVKKWMQVTKSKEVNVEQDL